jgi:hypothetical protein
MKKSMAEDDVGCLDRMTADGQIRLGSGDQLRCGVMVVEAEERL